MSIVAVSNLSKRYITKLRPEGRWGVLQSLVKPVTREYLAVDQISFDVAQGECVAYLGPNGAGKSTTIKMLTGILVPTAGEIRVNGLIPHKNRVRNSYNIGVVFGQRSQLITDLPVMDSFELFRYMYQIPKERFQNNLSRYGEILEVGNYLKKPVRTLSLGERMRCEILAALLHDPEILFLDEPTIGLDVIAKERIRLFIEDLNRGRGVTVILTTHDLADIERLCSRVVIIDKGHIIYDGSLNHIRKHYANERQIRAVLPDPESARTVAAGLREQPGLRSEVKDNIILINYDQSRADTAGILRDILRFTNPSDLVIKEEDIESLIRRIYLGGEHEGGHPSGGIIA